jgi:thiol-disulfide isomerase/thioredoxin
MSQEFEGNRTDFLNLLNTNEGVMIFKFTASWCRPCQSIKHHVNAHFENIASTLIKCYEVDVDECFDLFAFMKTKKMMKGIPTLMAYNKGSISFAPDESISGADVNDVDAFFMKCKNLL